MYACLADGLAAAVNVGVRPTFQTGRGELIEAHLIDFEGDLYGHVMCLEFLARLRGERRFETPAALVEQMRADVEQARALVPASASARARIAAERAPLLLAFRSRMTMTTERKREIAGRFGASERDTGNTKVQVALLTERIDELTERLRAQRKDHHSRRGLLMLVGRRRRFLDYLQRTDLEGYEPSSRSSGCASETGPYGRHPCGSGRLPSAKLLSFGYENELKRLRRPTGGEGRQ